MKRALIQLTIAALFTACACYANDKNGNPGISLNPQDVPIFYENNPLTGMKFFTVITCLPLKNPAAQKKATNAIEKSLETIGDIIHLKDNDMRGFGAGNILLIQLGNVTEWDGSEASMTRVSLNIETSVTVDNTGIKVFPMVWSINTFLKGSIDSCSENDLVKALQKLIGDFCQNYWYANQGQAKRPVFYTYD